MGLWLWRARSASRRLGLGLRCQRGLAGGKYPWLSVSLLLALLSLLPGGDEDAGPSGARPASGKPAGGAAAAAGGKRKGAAAAAAQLESGGKRGAKPEAKRRRRGRMEIEYEEEREDLRSTR